MKYINTTSTPIYIQVNGVTQLISPGQDITSDSSLLEFGLTASSEAKPKPKPVPPKPKKIKKSKTVKTNELPKSNKTED